MKRKNRRSFPTLKRKNRINSTTSSSSLSSSSQSSSIVISSSHQSDSETDPLATKKMTKNINKSKLSDSSDDKSIGENDSLSNGMDDLASIFENKNSDEERIDTDKPNSSENSGCQDRLLQSSNESDAIPKIRLVPISSLLMQSKQAAKPNTEFVTIDSSSDSNDDAVIIKPIQLEIVSKQRKTKESCATNNQQRDNRSIVNGTKQKESIPVATTSSEPKLNSIASITEQVPVSKEFTAEIRAHFLSVNVSLARLPKKMDSVLKKHKLSIIRDHKRNVIATNSERSCPKLRISSGSSSNGSDNSNESVALKKSISSAFRRTASKRLRLVKSYICDSHTDNDCNSDDSPIINRNLRMRKKNVPKSSNDVTDSSPSSSDDEIEENTTKKDSDEDFQPNKKRRVVRAAAAAAAARRQNRSDDDLDETYNGNTAKHRRRKRIKKNSDSSDDNDKDTSKKHGRKNIRKVIRTEDLEEETKEAAQRERERKKRIEERQKLYNSMYDNKLEEIKELEKLVLDFDPETKEELISVDRKLVKKLKPHQAQGVKFMWDACFESIEKLNENHGGGCILAHCMGLGKTLQVVTLVHTLLTHSEDTNVEKVLIICPVSTVLNWVNEFKIWLRHCAHNRDIGIFEISKYKQNVERANRIEEWHQEGGVLILGYDMFRNLSSETNRARKKQKQAFQEGLIDPGADLVVCDEGHLLKNAKTSLSKAVNRIRTLRRIVLTGTPLQNNLNEYYCMVQFVKPNLLGKYNEYLNRFVNPITNGQYTDSTPHDIQMMKRRSHILHKLLDGCVQRRDYSVLAPFLPPKQEYVLYVRLTKLQVDLYKFYMQHRPVQKEFSRTKSAMLFQDFQNLQRIWTHPRVLRYNSDRYEQMIQKKRLMASDDEEGSLKDFIEDDDDSDIDGSTSDSSSSSSNGSSVQSVHSDEPSNSKSVMLRRTRATAKDFEDEEPIEPIKEENPTEWWMPLCPEEELNNMEYSGKLMLLFSILAECEACGDKLLVFSQSLFSLDVIEHFLAMIDENTQNPIPDAKLANFNGSWSRGIDYFRLDGSTNIETRNANCINFNSEENSRARLFLISTRAGGLGINLVAANRVIIFDASWNPSHDIQSIFRVYRFGQKKPCYIYRFIALGTMEEKIYERQVTKLAISKRVIDEHQIDRHYKENDLMELYNIDGIDPVEDDRPLPKLPKDRLFAEQLQKYPNLIFKYHEHDSLLENKSDETLSNEEIEAAWKEFEEEKNRPTIIQAQPSLAYPNYQRAPGTGPVTSNNIFGFRTDILLQLLNIKARRLYPGTDNISAIVPNLLRHLYETMEKNDTSFYQELLYIQQTEMAAPAPGSYLTPAGHVMPAYSGRGRPPLNPQHSSIHMQQQHLIQQAQNRLMNMNNGSARMPTPTTTVTPVIEID